MKSIVIFFKKLFGIALTVEETLYQTKGPVLIAVPKPTPAPVSPPDTVVPPKGTVQFIDISRYQPTVYWEQVRKAGFIAMVTKCTDGASSEDPLFKTHMANAKTHGITAGAYCFNRFSADPIKQAEFFAKAVGDRTRWLVADIEFDKSKATLARFGDKYTKHMDDYAADHALKFLEHVTRLTGVVPWVYFNAYHLTGFKNPERFAKYPGWVSNYLQGGKPVKELNLDLVHLPPSYKKSQIIAWQYTDQHSAGKAVVNGDGLDANVAYLSVDALRKLASV